MANITHNGKEFDAAAARNLMDDEIAESAQGHASDALTLQEAWPE